MTAHAGRASAPARCNPRLPALRRDAGREASAARAAPGLAGKHTARLAVCSQAPGTKVHKSGTPFTDASGDRLREWMGVTPRNSTTRRGSPSCRWGSAFPARMRRARICRRDANARRCGIAELFAALPQLELVLAVGSYAQKWHLGDAAGRTLQETMRDWRTHLRRKTAPARPSAAAPVLAQQCLAHARIRGSRRSFCRCFAARSRRLL